MYYLKRFSIVFILVYIVISLPNILGLGYVIDWVPKATVFQKVKGYLVEGFKYGYHVKLPVSAFFALVFILIGGKRI
jgi:hypothetical protein